MSGGSKGGTCGAVAHRIKELLRLCSSKPLGGELKRSSNAAIRERRFKILFPTSVAS